MFSFLLNLYERWFLQIVFTVNCSHLCAVNVLHDTPMVKLNSLRGCASANDVLVVEQCT